MGMERRLLKLAEDVAREKSKVLVTFWPEEIKRESVFLTSVFGIDKVVEKTKLNVSVPSFG